MEASFIANALKEQRHPSQSWIFATEVNTHTGYAHQHQGGPGGIRRIDAFALALWPSKNFQRIAYEIKVSRTDWLNEIKDPMKRAQAWYLSNEFWFAIPKDVFKDEDWRRDMAGCGLLLINDDGNIKSVYRARKRKDCFPMPIGFVASLMRCVRKQAGANNANF
jgi:hypothetical protein